MKHGVVRQEGWAQTRVLSRLMVTEVEVGRALARKPQTVQASSPPCGSLVSEKRSSPHRVLNLIIVHITGVSFVSNFISGHGCGRRGRKSVAKRRSSVLCRRRHMLVPFSDEMGGERPRTSTGPLGQRLAAIKCPRTCAIRI